MVIAIGNIEFGGKIRKKRAYRKKEIGEVNANIIL